MIPRQAVIGGALFAFFLALNRPAVAQAGGFVYAVYVVNCGSRCPYVGPGDISAYLVNETTGALTEVDGSPILAGFNPAAIAARPNGMNVYVVNEFSEETGNLPGTLATYATSSSGWLLGPGEPIVVGSRPVSVAVDPSGQYLYVVNSGSRNISAFVLDTAGNPQPMLGSPFPAGQTPTSVAAHPNGQFLYVANSGDGTVSGYSINASTGELTPLSGSPFYVGPDPESFAVSPSGLHGYAMHQSSDLISGWPINPTTGALSSFSSYGSTGRTPSSVTVMLDPVGGQQLIYVTNFLSNDVTAFRGALTPVVGSPFPVYPAFLPVSSAVDPTGQFLYVASRSRNLSVSAFTINGTTGELTQIVGSPFPAGASPRAVTAVAVPIPGGNEP